MRERINIGQGKKHIYMYIHNIYIYIYIYIYAYIIACCCCFSVLPDSVQPHGQQSTRLLCPWDSPGKNTGVSCYFLLLIVHYGKTIAKMTRDYIYIFPGGSVIKIKSANAEDTGYAGSIPGSGRSPVRGNGNLLQYSCLKNPMDEEPGL